MPLIGIKRIYDPPSQEDGKRILVDRLWPRGVKKEGARIDEWLKEIAPSDELRTWFSHDPSRWQEFRRRYTKELGEKQDIIDRLRAEARKGRVTLLFAARDTEHNNAVVVREVIYGKRGGSLRVSRI
ncbi:MAG TPA: DUF488 domain-containing protein [Thermodesulfovibrionales bacterium]|nr:DUF488 domain-containing protein [Thermodesulfovibrionales bacterium]